MDDTVQWVTVARVLTAHGIRGEVRLASETDDLRAFCGKELRVAGAEPRFFKLERVRANQGGFIAKLSGVQDRNEALALRGQALQVPASSLPALPEGQYYHHQLLGLSVVTTGGEAVGRVIGILEPGGNDVYEVKTASGETVLIPAARDIVREVDLAGRRMVIEPLPGLLADDADAH